MEGQAINNAPMAPPDTVAITAAAFRAKYNVSFFLISLINNF